MSETPPSDRTPPTPPAPAAAGSGRWMRLLLIASLGLNLVILGLAGGHELSRAIYGPRPPIRELAFGPFTEALSPVDRRALLHDFFREAKGFVAQRAAMRADFRAFVAALRREPYDPAVFAGVMARQKQRTEDWMALGETLLADRIAQMTPAERLAFADRLQHEFDRHAARQRPAAVGQ